MSVIKREGRKVHIEGVRKMRWETGEMCEFASALVSAVESMGGRVPYDYVMGTCGAAFRFTLNPGKWDFTNYRIANVCADPSEPVRRAFQGIGYGCTIWERGTKQADAARIRDSIERGVPVLAFRVVGPSDVCIITGYDEGADVLLGWSTFQDIRDDHNIPHDVTGYFRKPGWHENIPGYILIGAKMQRASAREIYLDALKWAIHLMRTPQMANKCTGLAGLRAWAEEMKEEKHFPAGDGQTMGQRYVSTSINITMLRDHCCAAPFLAKASEDVPEFRPEISRAVECYSEVERIRSKMDLVISDNFSPAAFKAIEEPAERSAFAGLVLQIADKEEEAVLELERLLNRVTKGTGHQ